jgi:hypothetical protein
MAVKLAVLKSGEDIIADIKELIDDDGKAVSFVFKNPYSVKLLSPQTLSEQEELEREYKVSFIPWIPLSYDTDIAVGFDWVVTIVEPTKMLKESYEERMNGNKESNNGTSISEQYDSSNGD